MTGNKKLQVWMPLLFSLILIAGMFIGYGLDFFKTKKRTSLQEALELIRNEYVDDVNTDSLQGSAIQEMMNHLDPHSVYFPPVKLKEAIEELSGNFDGIGIEFNVFNDTVNVLYVIPDGPSDKAGLQIGDKILKVNDSSLTVKDLPGDKIKEYIRGEKNSTVVLTILRGEQSKKVTVTRNTIPVPSVDVAYMLDDSTGYIKLNKFTVTSYGEVLKSLDDMQKQGLRQLIFDLRGNVGGYMDEAIDIADEFLDGDKLIVYTEGKNSPKKEFRCKRPGLLEKGKVILLVDELSASASEVLSGALQDWDRAKIVGRRTFGKGLVQEQYELSDGSAIRLTVARYYTPLGRSIQRPYDKGKKVYMDEIWDRYSNGEALYADSNKINNGKQYVTPKGKVLYGGGGIMPDIFVPVDTSVYPVAINHALSNGSFNNFVYHYYLEHRKQVDGYNSMNAFLQQFNTEELWNEFISKVLKDSINNGSISEKQKKSLENRLEASLARFKWRNNGFYQVLNREDPAVIKAIEELKK